MSVMLIASQGRVVVPSFVSGARMVPLIAPQRLETQDMVMTRIVWLNNHGRTEEALKLLDEYCGS
jgi:hypothetical protein